MLFIIQFSLACSKLIHFDSSKLMAMWLKGGSGDVFENTITFVSKPSPDHSLISTFQSSTTLILEDLQ